jgi:hypothetical protein
MKRITALALLCVLYVTASAQEPTATQKAEMSKLNFLVGNWKGEGWIVSPDGQRRTFRQTERIQSKLGGTAILIEGEGKSRVGDKGEEVTMFQSLAIINYDDRGKRYRFVSQTNQGYYMESEARVIEGGMEWGFRLPQGGRIRYTIKLTEKGEWFEIGEMTPDEKNWRKFHEMTLQRVN